MQRTRFFFSSFSSQITMCFRCWIRAILLFSSSDEADIMKRTRAAGDDNEIHAAIDLVNMPVTASRGNNCLAKVRNEYNRIKTTQCLKVWCILECRPTGNSELPPITCGRIERWFSFVTTKDHYFCVTVKLCVRFEMTVAFNCLKHLWPSEINL